MTDQREMTLDEFLERELPEFHLARQQLGELRAKLDKAEQRADREGVGFRAMCEAWQRLEEIIGLDTGGGMGPAPALNAVERIINERNAMGAWINQGTEQHSLASLNRFIAGKQAEALQELYNQHQGEGMIRRGALLDKAIELQEEADLAGRKGC